jgi:hypothetical protein
VAAAAIVQAQNNIGSSGVLSTPSATVISKTQDMSPKVKDVTSSLGAIISKLEIFMKLAEEAVKVWI